MHRLLQQKWTSALKARPVHAQQRERAPTLSAVLSAAVSTITATPETAAAAEWATSKLGCHYTCAQDQSEGYHCGLHVFRSLRAQESRVYQNFPELP